MDCSSYSDQGSYQKQSNAYQMKHSSGQNFASFFWNVFVFGGLHKTVPYLTTSKLFKWGNNVG